MLLGSNHTWGDKIENGFAAIFGFIPELLAALAILVIGYIVAKIVASVIGRLLQRASLDRALTSGQGGQYVSRITPSPSRLLGRIALWALFLGAISLAVTALGINALTDFVGAIFAYLPNVIAALLIFLVAGAIAAGVGALVARTMGDTPTGKVVATAVPSLVMLIAVFMILNQLRIAPEIVQITYTALLFTVALASALAFGLGGRELAADILGGTYRKGREQSDQVRRDVELRKDRAETQAERGKQRAQQEVGAGGSAPWDGETGDGSSWAS